MEEAGPGIYFRLVGVGVRRGRQIGGKNPIEKNMRPAKLDHFSK